MVYTRYRVETGQAPAIEHDTQVWILHFRREGLEPTPAILNDLLRKLTTPKLRFQRSREFPGLVIVHRDVCYDPVIIERVKQLAGVAKLGQVGLGSVAPGLLSLYEPGTLLAVLVEPGVNIGGVVKEMRQILTI